MKWNDLDEIVEALDEQYIDLDLDDVKLGKLEKMIIDLTDFADVEDPTITILQEIFERWIEYRHNQ